MTERKRRPGQKSDEASQLLMRALQAVELEKQIREWKKEGGEQVTEGEVFRWAAEDNRHSKPA